jgi:hypothetical protein
LQRTYKVETLGDTRVRIRTSWIISSIAWSWKDHQTKRLWIGIVIITAEVTNLIIWLAEKWKNLARRIA